MSSLKTKTDKNMCVCVGVCMKSLPRSPHLNISLSACTAKLSVKSKVSLVQLVNALERSLSTPVTLSLLFHQNVSVSLDCQRKGGKGGIQFKYLVPPKTSTLTVQHHRKPVTAVEGVQHLAPPPNGAECDSPDTQMCPLLADIVYHMHNILKINVITA